MIPLLLVSAFFARAQDDEVAAPSTVDPSPYLAALVGRFQACLQAEGSVVSSEEADQVQDALESLSGALRYTEGGCTASAEAVAACAAAVGARSCDELHDDISALFDGRIGDPPPSWAITYGSALSSRTGECYELETGLPLDENQRVDLSAFSQAIAASMAQLASGCEIRDAQLAVCTQEAQNMNCGALGTQVNSGAEVMTRSFMAACEGWVDCGQIEQD